MQPKRLVLALLFSTAILIGWQFLLPIKPPPTVSPAKTAPGNPVNSASTQPSPRTSGLPSPGVAAQASGTSSTSSSATIPHRTITVTTPLYVAKFDSRGAVAVSWILLKNKESGSPLGSAGGTR